MEVWDYATCNIYAPSSFRHGWQSYRYKCSLDDIWRWLWWFHVSYAPLDVSFYGGPFWCCSRTTAPEQPNDLARATSISSKRSESKICCRPWLRAEWTCIANLSSVGQFCSTQRSAAVISCQYPPNMTKHLHRLSEIYFCQGASICW